MVISAKNKIVICLMINMFILFIMVSCYANSITVNFVAEQDGKVVLPSQVYIPEQQNTVPQGNTFIPISKAAIATVGQHVGKNITFVSAKFEGIINRFYFWIRIQCPIAEELNLSSLSANYWGPWGIVIRPYCSGVVTVKYKIETVGIY